MFSDSSGAGTSFPPFLDSRQWTDNFPETQWRSEGDLCTLLRSRWDARTAGRAFAQHRETYFTSADLEEMRRSGIATVRVPLGWWAFPPPDTSGFRREETLVLDPFAEKETWFASVDPQWLKQLLSDIARADLNILLDLHQLPGQTGPAGVLLTSMALLYRLTERPLGDWLDAYGSIVGQMQEFLGQLPTGTLERVRGVAPFNHDLGVDSRGYVIAAPSEDARIVDIVKRMMDIFVLRYLEVVRAHARFRPAVYFNLDNALSDDTIASFLRSFARLFREHSLDPSKKIVRAVHIFTLEWPWIFTLPTRYAVSEWVSARLHSAMRDQNEDWHVSCAEWSTAFPWPPHLRDITNERTRIASREAIYLGSLHAFQQLDVENIFWCWDLPSACSRPGIPDFSRMYWSLRCLLLGGGGGGGDDFSKGGRGSHPTEATSSHQR